MGSRPCHSLLLLRGGYLLCFAPSHNTPSVLCVAGFLHGFAMYMWLLKIGGAALAEVSRGDTEERNRGHKREREREREERNGEAMRERKTKRNERKRETEKGRGTPCGIAVA